MTIFIKFGAEAEKKISSNDFEGKDFPYKHVINIIIL